MAHARKRLGGEGPAFGPKPRDVQRAMRKNADAAMRARLSTELAPALDSTSSPSLGDQVYKATERALAVTGGDPVGTQDLVRREVRLGRSLRKRANNHGAMVLERWLESASQEQMRQVFAAVPSLREQWHHFEVAPSEYGIVVRCKRLTQQPAEAAKFLAADRKSNFGDMLRTDWSAKHMTIKHQDSQTLPDATNDPEMQRKRNQPPPCHTVVLCLCSDSGWLVRRAR